MIPAWVITHRRHGRSRPIGDSRQRKLGVPLPVFYSEEGKAFSCKNIRKLADLLLSTAQTFGSKLDDAILQQTWTAPARRNATIRLMSRSTAVFRKSVGALHPNWRSSRHYLEATDQHPAVSIVAHDSIALNNRAPVQDLRHPRFVVDLEKKFPSETYEKPKPRSFRRSARRTSGSALASSIDTLRWPFRKNFAVWRHLSPHSQRCAF